MADTLIIGGEPVPLLADDAVVFEDGVWRLERIKHPVLGHMWILYEQCHDFELSRGYLVRRDDGWYMVRSSGHQRWQSERITCDLDEAIGQLWAAREESENNDS